MKKGIHPKTHITTYICNSCSTKRTYLSTSEADVQVEVCAKCHPFYTGEAGTVVDSYSRVDRFQKQQKQADTDKIVRKRKKSQTRKQKTTEVKADKSVTLKDMMSQLSK